LLVQTALCDEAQGPRRQTCCEDSRLNDDRVDVAVGVFRYSFNPNPSLQPSVITELSRTALKYFSSLLLYVQSNSDAIVIKDPHRGIRRGPRESIYFVDAVGTSADRSTQRVERTGRTQHADLKIKSWLMNLGL
jgi:hypothetical protein